MVVAISTNQTEDLIKLVFRGLLPIQMMGCGVALLAMSVSVWSLLVGVPLIMLGMVFAVFTYDEVIQRRMPTVPDEYVPCVVCHKITPRFLGEVPHDVICSVCREDIFNGLTVKKHHN